MTCTPARASRRAMPAPILPRPMMPISMFAPEFAPCPCNGKAHSRVRGFYELSRFAAMARHGGDRSGRLARGLPLGAQARSRLLGLPGKQRALGGVGIPRPRLCAGRPAVFSRRAERARGLQERIGKAR